MNIELDFKIAHVLAKLYEDHNHKLLNKFYKDIWPTFNRPKPTDQMVELNLTQFKRKHK